MLVAAGGAIGCAVTVLPGAVFAHSVTVVVAPGVDTAGAETVVVLLAAAFTATSDEPGAIKQVMQQMEAMAPRYAEERTGAAVGESTA